LLALLNGLGRQVYYKNYNGGHDLLCRHLYPVLA
jgi:enterochelin esterase-like enzyme